MSITKGSTSYTSKEDFRRSYDTLFKTFATGKTKSLAWRKWQLKQVWWLVADNEEAMVEALSKDLNRHPMESYLADIAGIKTDILKHITHLEEWTADVIPEAGFIFGILGKARMRKEPLGVALIVGAWNFPLLLIIQPMVAAIAAGCCVMIKPSEVSKNVQDLIVDLVPRYMDNDAICVVTGGAQETGLMLENKFNHIFYTGSSNVARYVAEAAAKHLTPMVLELGGQGPAIVTKHANVDLAAKRIAFAKFMNAGQICLSVNHIFCDSAIYDQFVDRLKYWNSSFRNDDDRKMVRIVNERNFLRLSGLLSKTNGTVTSAGTSDSSLNYLAPTVVSNVKLNDSLLSEELFGPIAPVIEASMAEAITSINNMPHPLAIYIFSNNKSEVDHILNSTTSGGVTINDTLLHAAVPNAPFGGVGESGYGSYHGKFGVDAFSHLRTVVQLPLWLDKVMSFRYPPFRDENKKMLTVKNKLGFKRGETIADQRIGRRGLAGCWKSRFVRIAAVVFVLGLPDRFRFYTALWHFVGNYMTSA